MTASFFLYDKDMNVAPTSFDLFLAIACGVIVLALLNRFVKKDKPYPIWLIFTAIGMVLLILFEFF